MGRSHFSVRSALIIEDINDLKQKLKAICERGTSEDYITNNLKNMPSNSEPALRELGRHLINELKAVNELSVSEYKIKLLALADLYIKGYDLDWDMLYHR